jgi:assimilatory nitrate reductase catalytic subunit
VTTHVSPPVAGSVRTTCPYCGVGCGVVARPDGLGGAAIEGDADHPSNFGRLCSKGSALGETLGLEGRLLHPQVDGQRVSWDAALGAAANGFSRIVAEHGPDAVAFYLSGQLLTEDYYVANKLMKGFIGSANVDTNSRLCMASSVAGHRRAFGADTVPGCYEDLDEADLVILVGSNAAWCHPILFRRILDARARRGTRVVVIDPRRTATAEDADLFLSLAPGSDATLFSGLLVHLADAGALDHGFIEDHTTGFSDTLAHARAVASTPAHTAQATGLTEGDVATFFELFGTTERVVTCFSQGVNQSDRGTDKVNAIINCHLATGRIGRPGMGPLSLTGQPNAMGGREVGGLANTLAAHMNFSAEEVDRVRRFWRAPRIATQEGLKAVALFEAIAAGRIKALWIMATNPAVSLPDADAAQAALAKLDLLVVSENVLANDTVARGAHVLFPAAAWGEKDGTVTNSERRISRQRPFLALPGEAKPDWWIVAEVAKRMGFCADDFAYASAGDVFREHAALSAFENGGGRDFDIGALAGLSPHAYAALDPVQWPARSSLAPRARLFAEGGFFTPNGKARFVAPAAAAPARSSQRFPFILNTGRVRDQWHTMTRTGKSARLGSHRPLPFVEVHPADAAALNLTKGGLARVSSAHGSVILEVVLDEGQRPGSLFAPIHWSAETSSHGRVGALVHRLVDPVSGQPDAKATPVAIEPFALSLRGFVLSREPLPLPASEAELWWAKAAVAGGTALLFASSLPLADIAAWLRRAYPEADLAEYSDDAAGVYRCAALRGGSVEAVLFSGPADARPQWDAAKAWFASGDRVPTARACLSERMDGATAGAGPLVCACFNVSLGAIEHAIAEQSATTTEAIGELLRAGTNCGSCLPELRRVLVRSLDAVEKSPA